MTKSLTFHALLTRAAAVLDKDARELRLAHSYRGKWFGDYDYAKDAYDEMTALAKALLEAARYHALNPLGGPAKSFDACADAIRAGTPVDAAMRDFGLAWRRKGAR